MKKLPLNNPLFWDTKINSNIKTIIKSPIYINKIKIVLDLISRRSGAILDVGLGYGIIEKEISKNNLDLDMYGIDISKFSIQNARKNYRGKFVVAKINKIPFGNKKFDVVLALDILEHLSITESNKALSEIYRVMKRDGTLIISIPVNETKKDTVKNHHIQKYNLKIIRKQLLSFDFIIDNIYWLTAFKSFYYIKSLINNILAIRKPNLLIIEVFKK